MKVSDLKQLIREEFQNVLKEPTELEIREKIIKILTNPDDPNVGNYKTNSNDTTENIFKDFFDYLLDIDGPDKLAVAKLHGYESFDELGQLKSALSTFLKKPH